MSMSYSLERQHSCFRCEREWRERLRNQLGLELRHVGIMEWNFTVFSVYGTAVPLHPLRKTGGSPGHRGGDQPVLVQRNVVLEELVRNNHVLADEFIEVLDAIADELTVMGDDFERQIDGGSAGLAVTVPALVIRQEMPVKLTEHSFHLFVHLCQVRGCTEAVEENGIPFHFRNLQPHLVGIDQGLQQFLDDKTAMLDFSLADKP